jgi:hypothetical protein
MARSVGFAAASLGASRRMLSSDGYTPLDENAGAESIERWYRSIRSKPSSNCFASVLLV